MTRPYRLPATKWEIIIEFELEGGEESPPLTMNFGTQQAAAEFRKNRLRHKGTKSISQPKEVYSK